MTLTYERFITLSRRREETTRYLRNAQRCVLDWQIAIPCTSPLEIKLSITPTSPLFVILASRGWPVVVVDCGSALTFTAADARGKLVGGAILPGVRLQLAVLGTRTAQLPSDVVLPDELPPRQALEGVFSSPCRLSFRPPTPWHNSFDHSATY